MGDRNKIASIDLPAPRDVSTLNGRSLSYVYININIEIKYYHVLSSYKLCSQVVVRGTVSGHRRSTYLLKQSMLGV